MDEWLAFTIMVILGIVLLGPLFWSLHLSTKDLELDDGGWYVLKASLFDHVIGAIQIIFAVSWILLSIAAAFTGIIYTSVGAIIIFIMMFVMGMAFLNDVVFRYLALIKFRDDRLEYKALWRHISVYWNEVQEISMGINGPKIITPEGNVTLSNTRRGYYQLLELARKNGVPVQDNPYLKRPKHSPIFRK